MCTTTVQLPNCSREASLRNTIVPTRSLLCVFTREARSLSLRRKWEEGKMSAQRENRHVTLVKGQGEPLPSCCALAMDHRPTRKENVHRSEINHCTGEGGRQAHGSHAGPPEESGPAWAVPMVVCELFSSSLCQKPFFSSITALQQYGMITGQKPPEEGKATP